MLGLREAGLRVGDFGGFGPVAEQCPSLAHSPLQPLRLCPTPLFRQGCLNFVLLALLSFLREGQWTTRQIVITVLVVVSRVELGAFLFYRVLKRGKDGALFSLHLPHTCRHVDHASIVG